MRGPSHSFAVLAFWIAGSCGSLALAFDCSKTQEPIEQAICGDPAAKAADDAMDTAFRSLLGAVSGRAKEAALEDQRAWITERNRHCQSHASPPAACAKEKADARAAVLSGSPEQGPGLTPSRLQPVFLRIVSEPKRFEFVAQLFRFPNPQNAGERLLNEEADESEKLFDQATRRLPEKEEPSATSAASYHETWTLRYASPAFLSIWKEQDEFSGGAYPNGDASGLNIDLREGRILDFDDLFAQDALAPIVRLCLDDMEKSDRDGRLADYERPELESKVARSLGHLGAWAFGETEARVHFGAGTIADSRVGGTFECTLPYSQLGKLAKVPLPLR